MPAFDHLKRQFVAPLVIVAAMLVAALWLAAREQTRSLEAAFAAGARAEAAYVAAELSRAGVGREQAVLQEALNRNGRLVAARVGAPAGQARIEVNRDGSEAATAARAAVQGRTLVVDRPLAAGAGSLQLAYDVASLRSDASAGLLPFALAAGAAALAASLVFFVFARSARSSSSAGAAVGAAAREPAPDRALLDSVAAERRLLQELIDGLPFAVSIKEPNGRFLIMNRYAAREFDPAVGDAVEQAAQVAVMSEFHERMGALDREALERGTAVDQEVKGCARDGRAVYYLVGKVAMRIGASNAQAILTYGLDVTERHQSAAELARQRALLRSVLDELDLGVALKTIAGELVFINLYTGQQIGTAPLEVEGRSMAEVVPQSLSEMVTPLDRELLAKGEPVVSELTRVGTTPDLTYRVRKSLIRVFGYDEPLILTTTYDITDVRRAEAQTRNQRELLRAIADTDANIIFVKDAQCRYVMVNRAYCEIYGKSEAELLGRTAVELLGAAAQAWEDADRKVLETGEEVARENLQVDPRGVEHLYWQVKRPLHTADGSVLVLGVGVDITERKRHEAELERQQQFTRDVIDLDENFIFVKDAQHRFVLVNQAHADAHGRTKESFIGKTPYELSLNRAAIEPWIEQDRRVMREGVEVTVEHVADFGHGERHLHSIKRPITLADGSIGVLATVRDITDVRRYEAALRDALAQAQAASETKTRFLANMSHEIRTPINGIMGMTDLVLASPLTARQREYLRLARSSANALLAIVNDVLDVSKIEAGAMTVERVPFHLHSLLAAVCKPVALRAFEKGLDFELRLDLDVAERAIGDPTRLRQVLTNLVGNAAKFTERGRAQLHVGTVAAGDGTRRIRFAVQDTGPGIAADKQQRIFEPFVQADDSTTRRHGGTGLGLTISARLVDMMGGRITLASEAGAGCTFAFDIDLGAEAAVAPTYASLSSERIAWVTVRPLEEQFLQQCARQWGANVVAICAGCDLRPLTDLRIDAVVLDGAGNPEWVDALLDQCVRAGALQRVVVLDRPDVPFEAIKTGLHAAPGVRMLRLVRPVLPGELNSALAGVMSSLVEPGIDEHKDVASLAGLRVLLAEDNYVNRLLAVAVLEKLGARVSVAEDGAAAWELLEREPVDVVLMDIQMPVLDGAEVMQRRRAMERATGAPPARILAMTAHAMSGDRERFLASGFDGYISKPFSPAQLVEEIHRLGSLAPSVTTPAPDAAAFTLEAMKAAIGGDTAFIKQVASAFLEVRPGIAQRLRAAIAAGDPRAAAEAAHELKGMSAMLGAARLAATAAQLEQRARAGDAAALTERALIDDLEGEWHGVTALLQGVADKY